MDHKKQEIITRAECVNKHVLKTDCRTPVFLRSYSVLFAAIIGVVLNLPETGKWCFTYLMYVYSL